MMKVMKTIECRDFTVNLGMVDILEDDATLVMNVVIKSKTTSANSSIKVCKLHGSLEKMFDGFVNETFPKGDAEMTNTCFVRIDGDKCWAFVGAGVDDNDDIAIHFTYVNTNSEGKSISTDTHEVHTPTKLTRLTTQCIDGKLVRATGATLNKDNCA